MSLAVIHIVQLVPTFQQTPLLGVGYLFVIAATVVVGAHLVKGHQSAVMLWLPVAALGVAVFLGYAFTRVLSTPLDNQDVGNWACTLGMAALFVEGLMVAVAAYAISHGRRLLASTSARSGSAHSASVGDEATRRESVAWN